MKDDSVIASLSISHKSFLLNLPLYKLLENKSLTQFLIVSSKVMFVNVRRTGEHISTSPLTRKRVNNSKKSSVKITAFCQVMCVGLGILLY